MEIEVVRRRINMIAAHFSPSDHDSTTATHLLPLNCSSSLSSVIRRCDNRMNFARQCSASQGYFMRQASIEQASRENPNRPSENGRSGHAAEAPLFSRPTKTELNFSNIEGARAGIGDCNSPANSVPNFARPSKNKQFNSVQKLLKPRSSRSEWSPRMDVMESDRNYLMTVEIPGVNINGIKVEVNDKNLIIMGRRSSQSVAACSNGSQFAAYHRREIYQGPYRIVWPLPPSVNKDNITAEFIDGLLRVFMPKV